MKKVSILFLVFVVLSCGNKNIIPKEKFVKILTQIEVSTAFEKSINPPYVDSIIKFNNVDIVKENGFSVAQFDSTLSFYYNNIEEYKVILEEVDEQIKEMQKNISMKLDTAIKKAADKWKIKGHKKTKDKNKRDFIHN